MLRLDLSLKVGNFLRLDLLHSLCIISRLLYLFHEFLFFLRQIIDSLHHFLLILFGLIELLLGDAVGTGVFMWSTDA